ncbi:MAG: hypothetical protein WD825_17235 [Gemmatimonadaceae bacterium]
MTVVLVPRRRTGPAFLLLAIAIGLYLASCEAERREAYADRSLETQITAATRTASTLRARARTIHRESDRATARAKATTASYASARSEIAIDAGTGVVTGVAITPTTLPAPVIRVIALCDSVIPQLNQALDTTRAGWEIERAASDTQLVADSLKDRRRPSRCGTKCGVVAGATGATVVLWLASKVVRAIARPSLSPVTPAGR